MVARRLLISRAREGGERNLGVAIAVATVINIHKWWWAEGVEVQPYSVAHKYKLCVVDVKLQGLHESSQANNGVDNVGESQNRHLHMH